MNDSKLLVGVHSPSSEDRGVAFTDQFAVGCVRISKEWMLTVRVTLMQNSIIIMARMLSTITLVVLVNRQYREVRVSAFMPSANALS